MTSEKIVIDGIPVLVSRPMVAKPWPLLLLSHGFTGNKENWASKFDELTASGILVVAMDNRLHGERAGPGFGSLFSGAKLSLPALRRVMQATAADMSVLIDHFSKDKAVDASRIAVAGVSMGGFVSFEALVSDNRIKVAAPIIASPYWGDIPGDCSVDVNTDTPENLAEFARENEPARRKESIPPRALLMQIGGDDRHYDGHKVELFYSELRKIYGDQEERVRLVVHPGIGHELTPQMWSNAVAWFQKYL